MNYELKPEQYAAAIELCRNYLDNKAHYEDSLSSSPAMDGQPRGTAVGDPTERATEKRLRYRAKIVPVEKAIKEIPDKYRQAIWLNAIYNRRWSDCQTDADRRTLRAYRRRFIYHIYEISIKK